MRWAFFGGIAGVAFCGCTLLVETDDLAGGLSEVPPEGGTSEAGPGRNEGGRGRTDGARVDGEADGAAGVCPPNPIICDDFESEVPGKWEIHKNGSGAVDFPSDAKLVHGGTRSFRSISKTSASVGSSEAELRLLLAQPKKAGATIFFRAYVYLPGPVFHDTTISKWRTPADNDDDLNLKVNASGHIIIDADNADAGTELTTARVLPTGQWLCLDWRAALGAPGHELVLVDGVTHIDKDDINVTADGYNAIGLGFVAAEPDHDLSVLFDDVIISETLVGCP